MKDKLRHWIMLLLILCSMRYLSGCGQSRKNIERFEDLNQPGITISFPDDLDIIDVIHEKLPNAKTVYMAAVNSIEALKNNKIDGFVIGQAAASKILESNPDFKMLEDAQIRTYKVAFALSEHCEIPDFENRVNAFVAEKVADGTIAEIYARWSDEGKHELPEAPKVKNPEYTIRVATNGAEKPFCFFQDGKLTGSEIEIANLLGSYLNAKVEFVTADWGALLAGVSTGKYDVVASNLFVTKEREKEALFSDPYVTTELKVLVRADSQTGSNFFNRLKEGFEKTFVQEGRWKMILSGLGVTLVITVFGFISANLAGGILCWMSLSQKKALRIISDIYTGIIQGTPMVVVLLILFYIIFGKSRVSGISISILAFALTSGAYLSGIFQSGIKTVDPGQREAALALGMTKLQAFCGIVVPQAARHSLTAYFAEFIGLMKETAVVGYVTVTDLTKVSDLIRNATFDAIVPLLSVAMIYLALTWCLIGLMNVIKKKLERRHTVKDLKVVAE